MYFEFVALRLLEHTLLFHFFDDTDYNLIIFLVLSITHYHGHSQHVGILYSHYLSYVEYRIILL